MDSQSGSMGRGRGDGRGGSRGGSRGGRGRNGPQTQGGGQGRGNVAGDPGRGVSRSILPGDTPTSYFQPSSSQPQQPQQSQSSNPQRQFNTNPQTHQFQQQHQGSQLRTISLPDPSWSKSGDPWSSTDDNMLWWQKKGLPIGDVQKRLLPLRTLPEIARRWLEIGPDAPPRRTAANTSEQQITQGPTNPPTSPHSAISASLQRNRPQSWPTPPTIPTIANVLGQNINPQPPSTNPPVQQPLPISVDADTPLASGLILQDSINQQAINSKEDIWTCLIKNDWKPSGDIIFPSRKTRIVGLAVKKGQEGYTIGLSYPDNEGNLWMRFNIARTNIVGWVLRDNLTPGQKYGPLRVVDHTELIPLSNIMNHKGTVLQKTIRTLLHDIAQAKDVLSGKGADIAAIQELIANASNFETIFLKGIPSQVREVIDGGDFSFEQLWQIPQNPNNWINTTTDKRVIIYVILFKGLNGVSEGFYVGKTIDAGTRRSKHNSNLQNPNIAGTMYSIGRKAKAHRMLLLCDITSVHGKSRQTILRLAEHVSVCLFRSWLRRLTSNFVDDPSLLSEYYFDITMAKSFNQISGATFDKTGWKPPIGQGLNWKTPLTEVLLSHTSFTCHVFTPDSDNGPVRVYRSALLKVRKVKIGTVIADYCVLFKGGKDLRGMVTVPLPMDIQFPEKVYLVVEICTGPGKRHPVPYGRLPEPGPFTGWQDLNRIGIRCEWQEKNQWKTVWLQARKGFFLPLGWPIKDQQALSPRAAEAYPHTSNLYIKLRCIYDTLMSVIYTEGELYPWIKLGPRIVITQFLYNHLQQIIHVQEQQPTHLDPPRLRGFDENKAALVDLYGSNIYFEPIAGLNHSYLDVKIHCSLCYEASQTPGYFCGNKGKRDNKVCPTKTQGTMSTCARSFALRRPCIFLPVGNLVQSHGKFRFAKVVIKDLRGPQNISGPSAASLATDGPISEEVEDTSEALQKEDDTLDRELQGVVMQDD